MGLQDIATLRTTNVVESPYDSDVKKVWEELLRIVHLGDFTNDPPDLDKWHRKCNLILEQLLPTSSRFVGFARHACNSAGLLYPTLSEVEEDDYINDLKVPGNKKMHCDDIFDFASETVRQMWVDVARHALGL